jgi:hypothetical protein
VAQGCWTLTTRRACAELPAAVTNRAGAIAVSAVYATRESKATLKTSYKLSLPAAALGPPSTAPAATVVATKASEGQKLRPEPEPEQIQMGTSSQSQQLLADVIATLPPSRLPALAWAVLRRDVGAADSLAVDLRDAKAVAVNISEGAHRTWWPSLLQAARSCGLSSATIAGSVSVRMPSLLLSSQRPMSM